MSDIIIVGAGPVGLWLACELRLAGIGVTVLERRPGRVDQSRALSMHGRSLEIFAMRGLSDRFLTHGVKVPGGHFAVLDTRLDFSAIDSSQACSLFIPQKKTEEIIEERAIELGVELRRGVVVENVDQHADGIRVEVKSDRGSETLSAQYVVGADGARSVVRGAAGIEFPGTYGDFSGMMGDVVLGKALPAPVVSTVNDKGCLMVAPLGDGKHHRIVVVSKDEMHKPKTDALTVGELAAAATAILGDDMAVAPQALWLSRFDNETRLAAQYRKGRIFLAGDAGHIHFPAGGQGMNVGFQDATNLGWKLAMVVKGEAPEALLDTYDDERRTIGEYLHDNTIAQTHLITSFSPGGLALRATLSDLLKVQEANLHLAQQVSGFGFSYPTALMSDQLEEQWRVPDRPITLTNGLETTIYASLMAGKWAHLAVAGASEMTLPAWLDRSNVEFVTVKRAERGLFGMSAILVRPDGHAALSNRTAA